MLEAQRITRTETMIQRYGYADQCKLFKCNDTSLDVVEAISATPQTPPCREYWGPWLARQFTYCEIGRTKELPNLPPL